MNTMGVPCTASYIFASGKEHCLRKRRKKCVYSIEKSKVLTTLKLVNNENEEAEKIKYIHL